MASHLIRREVPANTTVIRQGEPGDYFYVVDSGSVKVVRDGEQVATDYRGDSFGEMALLYNCPRNATLITLEPCTLWCVDRITFRSVVMRYHMEVSTGAGCMGT